jgi:hypothetical protein
MKNIVGAMVLFLSAVGTVQAADVTKFCVGEHQGNCESGMAWYPCGTNTDAVARQICTVRTQDGNKVLDHTIRMLSTKEGHRCGYTVLLVECR